jgi:hypothetical protein
MSGKRAKENRKRAPATTPERSLGRSLLVYLRTLGAVSVILGLAALMQGPEYFWWFAGLICAAFALIAIDIFFESWPRRGIRWIGFPAMSLAAAAFSFFVVFADVPLQIQATFSNARYADGVVIGGIKWRPDYAEMTVEITNPTTKNYDDIAILLRPDFPIAAIAQSSNLSGVSFEDKLSSTVRLQLGGEGIPKALVATDVGYRIRCERLPRKTTLKIEIALVDIKWNPDPKKSAVEGLLAKNELLRIYYMDHGYYWFGHPQFEDVFAPRPRASQTVKAEGDYTAVLRRRHIGLAIKPININSETK